MSAVRTNRHQIRPRRSLLGPRPHVGHCPEGPLGHRLGAVHVFDGQDSCLEVGRQEEEVEELGAPRPRQPQLPHHVGTVGDVAPVDGGLEAVRESELPSDLWRGGARARAWAALALAEFEVMKQLAKQCLLFFESLMLLMQLAKLGSVQINEG